MTDLEKRAHDIAVSILPRAMEEDQMPCFVPDGPRSEKFNTLEIATLYEDLYEELLKELAEYGGF